MIRIGGKIPIAIYPSFWILAGLIAFLFGEGSILRMVIWVGVIFISVLFHEFGHALTALMFGRKPRIELVAMGGLTYHDGDKLPYWKQLLITINGPLFGFIIVILVYLIKDIPALSTGHPGELLLQILVVNLIWTGVNLLPILPLDGGQVLRLTLEKVFEFKGLRYAFMISAILSLLFALFLFLTQNLLAGAVFFLFAFENFNNFRRSRFVSGSDRIDTLKQALLDAEMQLRQGHPTEALQAFETLRITAKEGVIFDAASQYAAFLHYDKGEIPETYQILLPLKERLDPNALVLLHRVAFEKGDFALVIEIAGPVFQYTPEAEVALRTAYAAAHLHQVESSVGWLQTAHQSGVENLKEIVQEHLFDAIRNDPVFQKFINHTL